MKENKSAEELEKEIEQELDVFRQETSIIISEHLEEFELYKTNDEKYKATDALNEITQKKWGIKLCLIMVEEYFNDKIKSNEKE